MLRDEAITHMAQAYLGTIRWNRAEEGDQAFFREGAELQLDALLGFLTEHTEEWKEAAYGLAGSTDRDTFGAAALAALRGTTEEPQ